MRQGKIKTPGAVGTAADPEKFTRKDLIVSRLSDDEGDTIAVNDGTICFIIKTDIIKQLIEETEA